VATDPRDGDDAVLERLPQRLEDGAGELRQLIHEENPKVRECARMYLEASRPSAIAIQTWR
jgi:hypothetical protein